MTTIDLTTRRLDRLDKAQRQGNTLLGQCVKVLEAHSRHFERMEEAMIGIAQRVDRLAEHVDRLVDHVDHLAGRLTGRLDRLTAAIARGRTQDLARFDDHERRLRTLEARPRKR